MGRTLKSKMKLSAPGLNALESPHPKAGGASAAATPQDLSAALERIAQLEHELAETRSAMTLSSELLRNTNREINFSLKTMERLNSELVEMDRLKTEFLANISHELRTPLNAIIGGLQMIADGLYDNEAERETYVNDSLLSAHSLLAVINNMLDVTKVNAGKLSLDVQPVAIEELFEQLYEKLSPAAQRAGLELRFQSSLEKAVVLGDRSRVAQIFSSLIDNSIKFTPQGSITVTCEPYPGEEHTVLFSVTDTGIGIPESYHDKAFEMFVQVDGSSRRKYEGTGLGLTICKRLVEFMGGTIWIVKTGRERGTTISFTLPAAGKKSSRQAKPQAAEENTDELLPETF